MAALDLATYLERTRTGLARPKGLDLENGRLHRSRSREALRRRVAGRRPVPPTPTRRGDTGCQRSLPAPQQRWGAFCAAHSGPVDVPVMLCFLLTRRDALVAAQGFGARQRRPSRRPGKLGLLS
jgi:hypothetical protein